VYTQYVCSDMDDSASALSNAVTASPSGVVSIFHDIATAVAYTLSLHDALPISLVDVVELARACRCGAGRLDAGAVALADVVGDGDRKSTRLNSSHVKISYAVFCLKKKSGN